MGIHREKNLLDPENRFLNISVILKLCQFILFCLLCLFCFLVFSVDHGGKLGVSCLLYNNLSYFILNQRVLKMILFGIFYGHLKIYIC